MSSEATASSSTEPPAGDSNKRAVEKEEEETNNAKRPRPTPPQPAPIYLFATATDVQARRGHGRDHWSRKQCRTLREMLGIGDYSDDSTTMGPIDWLLMANYIVNFEFLLDECPELLSLPRAVCIYGSKEGTEDAWRQACTTLDGSCSVDFLCRNPSDPAGGATNPLGRKIPFGVHHTKLFLVGYSSGLLRVVIHTANLRFSDIHHKAQGAYIQDFARKSGSSPPTSDFEEALINYLESYKYHKQHKWDDQTDANGSTLIAQLRKYDFSPALVTLIPSVPGYHKINQTNNNNSNKYGHLKVREQVANLGQRAARSNATNSGHITCQFSSIGSLTKKYLHRLAYSMDVHRASPYASTDSEDDESKTLPLQLVYPTSDEICNSLEGYRGGNSVPGHKKNVTKDFLKPLFRKWSASGSFLSSLSLSRKEDANSKVNPLWKGNNVPHIKSYFQLSNKNEDSMEWFMIGSHNLSKAAWGDVVNSKMYNEKRLFIRHWELGVFFSPEQLHAKRLVPWTPERAANANKDPTDITVPLPYRVKALQYKESDKPWAVDERYVRLDIFGRRSASDA